MSKIESINLPILTDSIKNLLIKQQIITVIDFLKEDTCKLTQCQLTIQDIEYIKSYIFDNYGVKPHTAYDIFKQFEKNMFIFKTGIER